MIMSAIVRPETPRPRSLACSSQRARFAGVLPVEWGTGRL
jgi:hypothetical protein